MLIGWIIDKIHQIERILLAKGTLLQNENRNMEREHKKQVSISANYEIKNILALVSNH